MSLSQYIIYGSLDDVRAVLAEAPPLDEIDEYGYTPLIQSAIINQPDKAKLLLDKGASVDFKDLTGRTALHWAADNENLGFCELLLSYHADPNAYTRAGQPVLAMPLLRQSDEIKKALYRYGADINFALDFINAKLLGHRFELEGRVDLIDPHGTFFEIEFEGFYFEFSLAIVLNALIDFKNNFGGKHLRAYFPKVAEIITGLRHASELLRYQHYLTDHKKFQSRIDELLKTEPLILPVAYDGHAITLIKFKQWLIRCDRGAYGRDHGTVIIYRLQNPQLVNREVMKYLLYKRQHRSFIENHLEEQLQLKVIRTLALPPQISGNCAWANVEAVIPATMFLLLLQEGKNNSVIDLSMYEKKALYFYQEWQNWDKDRALYFCMQSFEKAKIQRQISKAAILAAILFQQCQYGKPTDLPKAERILDILTRPALTYILKGYLAVFSETKQDPRYKNLVSFLEDYGVSF